MRLLLAGLCLLVAACAIVRPDATPELSAEARSACRIVFDAGSSGTRLYVYERVGTSWVEHEGPKVSALADPVRQIRGKRHADIDAVSREIAGTLELIRRPDPSGRAPPIGWSPFDWRARCEVESAAVLATAGMRIAEHEDPDRSRQLWRSLGAHLTRTLPPSTRLTARTSTGFEEGLHAWLAVRQERTDARFGIVEMGGASTQIAFPCDRCDPNDDAVREVLIDGRLRRFYSYSFLGLGQDEAPNTLGRPASCAYGIGLERPGWKPGDCDSQIGLGQTSGLPDPWNHGSDRRGTSRSIPVERAEVDQWLLTGAFNYWNPAQQIDTCCRGRGACYGEANSCFRPIFLDKYLRTLGVPPDSPKSDANWTLGAVICEQTGCLRPAPVAPLCRWSRNGCLAVH